MAEKQQEYTAPKEDTTLKPGDLAAETFATAGRRAGQLGQEKGQMLMQSGRLWDTALKEVDTGLTTLGTAVTRHESMQEITTGFAGLSSMAVNLDQDLTNTLKNADPFDPDVVKNWLNNTVNPQLQDFVQSFSTPAGKEWAAEHASVLATEQYRHAIAANMQRGNEAAVGSYQVGSNALTSMVANNPGTADTAMALVPKTMQAIMAQSNIAPAEQEKFAAELTQKLQHGIAEAQIGAILGNPQTVGTDLEPLFAKYGSAGILSGADIETARRTQTNLQLTGQRQQLINMDITAKQQTIVSNKAASVYMNSLSNPETAANPQFLQDVMKDGIGNNGKLTPEMQKALIGAAITIHDQQGHVVTDPTIRSDLITRASLDPTDPRRTTQQQVYEQVGAGKLSPQDAAMVVGYINRKAPEDLGYTRMHNNFIAQQSAQIIGGGLTGKEMTKNGPAAALIFEHDFELKYQQALRSERPNEALEGLFNPASPTFVGKTLPLDKYLKLAGQQPGDTSLPAAEAPAGPPKTPDEKRAIFNGAIQHVIKPSGVVPGSEEDMQTSPPAYVPPQQ